MKKHLSGLGFFPNILRIYVFLQNRVWQRDTRDKPVIQPDASYFNEVF